MSDELDIDTADVENYVSQSLDPVATLTELGFINRGEDADRAFWLRRLGRGFWESVTIEKANGNVVYRKLKRHGRGWDGEFTVLDYNTHATLNDIRRKVLKWKHGDARDVVESLLDSTEDNPDALDPKANLEHLVPHKCPACQSSNLSSDVVEGMMDCYSCGIGFSARRVQENVDDPDDPDDPLTFINAMEMPNPRITVSYAQTTPESSANGDTSETGWIDEEGKEMTPDQYDYEEGLGVADLAVKFLEDEGACHASSSHFHPGVWYSTEYQTIDYRTGTDEERCFHLVEFTEAEERAVWDLLKQRERQRRQRQY